MHTQMVSDLETLITQLDKLKDDFNSGIINGKSFVEVKVLHLQIKELTQMINQLKIGDESQYRSTAN